MTRNVAVGRTPLRIVADSRYCRVLRCYSPEQHELIALTTVDEGIALAEAIGGRCVVVLTTGEPVFDNLREY